MRVLLSTIGSRGDVQPLVALAHALRATGQDVHMCVPPDFRPWIEGLGILVTPVGPEVRRYTPPAAGTARPTAEQLRLMTKAMVVAQFEALQSAVQGCDVIVGATALQIAAPSVAERVGIPYVFAAYCPAVLPSEHHAPPVLRLHGQIPDGASDHRALWAADAQRFHGTFGDALNEQRGAVGLPPVTDVRRHVLTDHPWLAADPMLAPWPDPEDRRVYQTGAWFELDERPLSPEIEAFLDAGDPPLYFGFGSMHARADLSSTMIQSARRLGRRALILGGWAEFALPDTEPDCLLLGEINQQALFTRVAAVVHHGGAGTTTAAALAGTPQVVVPQMYDQYYWAQQVERLGIGTAHGVEEPTVASLTGLLGRALEPDVVTRARAIARTIRRDGAMIAADKIIGMAAQP